MFIPYTPSYIFIDHVKPLICGDGLDLEQRSNTYLTTMVLHSRDAVIPNLTEFQPTELHPFDICLESHMDHTRLAVVALAESMQLVQLARSSSG